MSAWRRFRTVSGPRGSLPHEEYVAGETLATSVGYLDGTVAGEPVRIENRELFIAVERA